MRHIASVRNLEIHRILIKVFIFWIFPFQEIRAAVLIMQLQCLSIQALLPISFLLGSTLFYLSIFNILFSPMLEHLILMVRTFSNILLFWNCRLLEFCPQFRQWSQSGLSSHTESLFADCNWILVASYIQFRAVTCDCMRKNVQSGKTFKTFASTAHIWYHSTWLPSLFVNHKCHLYPLLL